MEEMAIQALVESRRGEADDFELKKGTADVSGAVATLTAFANDFGASGKGGWVVFGVDTGNDDHGFAAALFVGLDAASFKEIEGKVLTYCRDNVEPGLVPRVVQESLENGRRLLAFQVATSRQLHFYSNGKKRACYVRSGSHTSEARGGLYAELLRQKAQAPPYLDEPCVAASLADLDFVTADYFFRQAGLPRAKEAYFEPDQPIDANTKPLVVRDREGKPVPTLLAILLFGREPTRFLPGAWAILSSYTGNSKAAVHNRKVELVNRALPDLITKLTSELQPHLPIDIDKSYSAQSGQQNRWLYSGKALDEAIVNALAHRDYTSTEPTRVTVFDDRIEIWNPGGAPLGVEGEKLQEGEAPALWRNPSLAAFLLRLGLAQREGQGLRTILDEAQRIGAQAPLIRSTGADFTVTLYALPRHPAQPSIEISSADALILISIGASSALAQVESQRQELGLSEAQLIVDIALPGYVEKVEDWEQEAKRIRNEIRDLVNRPEILRFHLFYRGPVVMAPLLGALIVPAKPLWLYHYENGRYRLALKLDKRFLVGAE